MIRVPVVLACLAACGGRSSTPSAPTSTAKPPPSTPVAPTTAQVPTASSAPPSSAPWSPDSLPTLPVVHGARAAKTPAEPMTVLAVDADGDRALQVLAPPGFHYVSVPTRKRLTGRIEAASQEDAFASIAAALGSELTPIRGPNKGATVSIDFSVAPVRDILYILNDTSGGSLVVAEGELPDLSFHVSELPWDTVLTAIAPRIGRTIVRKGSTMFLVPAGTTIPAVDGKLPKVRLDLHANQATVAQISTALRAVAPLRRGSCATTRVTLMMHNATVAEIVRATEVAANMKLDDAAPCPSTVLADEPASELDARVFVRAGTKRLALFDHHGALVTAAETHPRIEYIGTRYLSLVGQPHPDRDGDPPVADDAWAATLKRTSMVILAARRRAVIVTTEMERLIDEIPPPYEKPEGVTYLVTPTAVDVLRDGAVWRTLPLAPAGAD